MARRHLRIEMPAVAASIGLHRGLVPAAGLMTLGSGILNLVSAASRGIPRTHALLGDLFPIEFLHVSRFLSLLLGFALVVSSINIFKRKKRAAVLVLAMALLSAVLHVMKGPHYIEAGVSLLLAVLLVMSRREFTVKSGVPDLSLTALRLLLAVSFALAYGILGFWLLDKREFGLDFDVVNSIRNTISALIFAADPGLLPRTRFAAWFLDSLKFISVTTIVYSLSTLFRPVFYRLSTLPHERALAAEILETHGRSSLDVFKLAGDKTYFFAPASRSFLAYRVVRNFAVVLADPVGPEEDIPLIVGSFLEFCRDNDWKVAFHQTLPDFLPVYRDAGLKKLKIGEEAVVDLMSFSLDGKRMKHLRHYTNQFEKEGIRAVWLEPPIAPDMMAGLRKVSDDWLKIGGRRERGFTMGGFDEKAIMRTPVFAAIAPDGLVLAFMNVIRSYRPGETTIDLMRHLREAPEGIMDFLFVALFRQRKESGFRTFSLGMAPMSGFREGEEAGPEERAVQRFLQRLNFLFSYGGLYHYKAKYATAWEPRYTVYQNVLDLPRLAMAVALVTETGAAKEAGEDEGE